ncbi:XRE family transcriptional regulator [Hymenobacter gummosus]|uniref:XRE family transcriptional regulator n=1 Tax=Hymenobacter gummosus TaxID=1776032 RepID=A0A431U872_9BACT|nr:XRE family transcriptional regulator [Hymenobacter gummosus]RTQ53429.1 XRE family transcriptional regulator [Hymenobacter gummosus]
MKSREDTDPRLHQIGARLRELRVAAGYSSYETFAFEHELPRVTYGKHEKGSNITMKSLLRILDIHRISLADFFAGVKA